MQRIQRKVGVFTPHSEDDAQVAAMLAEFKELVDATSHWREAWAHILTYQLHVVTEFEAIYKPMAAVGDGEPNGRVPAETPHEVLERSRRINQLYDDLKNDMMEEVSMIDRRLIKPAQEAKQTIKPMHKVIQKREDKKLDYERYKGRVEKLENQANRSARDESALAKNRIDMERCEGEFDSADRHLQANLPNIVAAVLSLLPYLLASQIEIQNNILGNLYTVQHEFCQDYGYPSPPPDMAEIVLEWDAVFTPLRKDIETNYQLLMHTKLVHQPMELPESRHGTVTGLNLRNTATDKFNNRPRITGRPSSSSHQSHHSHQGALPSPAEEEEQAPPKPPRPRNSFSNAPPSPDPSGPPPINLASRPKIPTASKPRIGSTSSNTLSPYDGGARRPSSSSSIGAGAYSPGSPRNQSNEYFNGGSSPGRMLTASPHTNGVATPLQGIAAGIGAKKKPPPPPPKKRLASFQKEDYVTAMYDFQGQGPGDLSFREGDRIKVLKREGDKKVSWWEGELNGMKGSFPANYTE
ncbi:sh3 domain signaling protein [Diplodia corticola]|uniref:Sh3 domain signaling protein n=1 Tax=Diplodia corticola TaxID=236234 RepID=A0A1J9R7A1_9PEZI|nr:sh3 domain signaling protein [Diplodia corticola]OJD36082.1 sh3 domain signaling protein [Diplodia corticola]